MVNEQLVNWINENLEEGFSLSDLSKKLLESGYSQPEIDSAMNAVNVKPAAVKLPTLKPKIPKLAWFVGGVFALAIVVLSGLLLFPGEEVQQFAPQPDIVIPPTDKDGDGWVDLEVSVPPEGKDYKDDKKTPVEIDERRVCTLDQDCVLVMGKRPCGCPTAINSEFLEVWNKEVEESIAAAEESGIQPSCAPCIYHPDESESICKENVCKLTQKITPAEGCTEEGGTYQGFPGGENKCCEGLSTVLTMIEGKIDGDLIGCIQPALISGKEYSHTCIKSGDGICKEWENVCTSQDDCFCVKEGEYRPQPFELEEFGVYEGVNDCCGGLVPRSLNFVKDSDKCPPAAGGSSICINCGDGVCGTGESYCKCPEDCEEPVVGECLEEGESYPIYPGYEGPTECCDDLSKIPSYSPFEGECLLKVGSSGVCTNCGDWSCGIGEDPCNCPKDCERTISSEEECIGYGGVWGKVGISPTESCIIPMSDAGESCTDNDQCLGDCIIPYVIDVYVGKCVSQYDQVGFQLCIEHGGTYSETADGWACDIIIHTSDGGELCKDNNDCEARCERMFEVAKDYGICSTFSSYKGCHDYLKNGELFSICAD